MRSVRLALVVGVSLAGGVASAEPSTGSAAGAAVPRVATTSVTATPVTGDAPPQESVEASAPRLWSRGLSTWIWPSPRVGKPRARLGYVRVGTSLAVRDAKPVVGQGCAAGFVAVRPYGYVCLDRNATLGADAPLGTDDRYLRAMQTVAPQDGLLPFAYALSNGAPMYRRLPARSEWTRETGVYGDAGSFKPQAWGNRGHAELAEVRVVEPSGERPFFLDAGGAAGDAHPVDLLRRTIPHGSMLAFTRAFQHEGRSFLLSADGTVVPADRVRPFRVSSFHGVELGGDVALPIAFFRQTPRPRYVEKAGVFEPTGEQWPARGHTQLDPAVEAVESNGRRYLATREHDAEGRALWTAESDATPVRAYTEPPIGIDGHEKWITISITRGTLVAYERMTPVFTTLISPGIGGVPLRGKDPVKMSTTPIGVFRITYKHRAATMSPEYGENRKFWIADVPYTQYFAAPFALHTAYWHESFGEPRSAGCVNLSPEDGRRLFEWTEPKVPDGWWGAGSSGMNGKGTYVAITR